MRTHVASERHHVPDPAALSAQSDLHRAVQQHVDELPADLRVPLLLRCQDELTLVAIGSALQLPTSTVHDRVEAALQRLRASLAGRGHALGALALPQLLADAVPPPAPLGLQARLLALGDAAVPVAAGLARRLAVAVVSAGAAAGLAFVLWNGFAEGNGPVAAPAVAGVEAPLGSTQDPPPAPGASREPVPVSPPVAAANEQPPVRDVATFTGTVHDAEAWPVAGATVLVVAGGGYKAFDVGAPATTDARGTFTVTARSSWLDLRAVRLIVRENGRVLLQTGDLAVPRAAAASPLELVLPAKVGTATSRYDFAVAVRDEAGQPLAGVPVSLLEPQEPAPRPDLATREANGTTGADGRAVLSGRGLGTKWLFVDGRPLQRGSSFERIAIDKAGQHQRDVALAAGAELTVVVSTVSGRRLEWGQPWLVDEGTGLQLTPQQQPDGSSRFRGLGPGPFTVHANGDGRTSPAVASGVKPSAQPLALRLKERDDETDVGDHMAELHGALVDAATGDVVPYSAFQVTVKPFLGGGSSLVFDGVEPPRPAQQMESSGTWRSFHEVGLGAGRYVVVAAVPGYALAGEVVGLRDRELRTGLRILLQRQAIVRGKVVDAAGVPLAGVSLFAIGTGPLADAHLAAWREHSDAEQDPGERDPAFHPVSGWSRKDGTFEVDQVPPGVPLRLVARHDRHGLVVLPLPVLRAGEVVAGFDVRLR